MTYEAVLKELGLCSLVERRLMICHYNYLKGSYKNNREKFFSVVADEVAVAKSQKLLFWRLRLDIRKNLFT